MKIFPTLQNAKWLPVNLNAMALERFPPAACERPPVGWFADVLKERKPDEILYGGFLEDRRWMHKGYYMDPDNHCHWGVDFWVPEYTPVTVPAQCEVIHTDFSNDGQGDWGGVVYFFVNGRKNDAYFMYGHMLPESLPSRGAIVRPGQIAGLVAPRSMNGNWTPHLHVQRFTAERYLMHKHDLIKMDGYGPLDEVPLGIVDPLPLVMAK